MEIKKILTKYSYPAFNKIDKLIYNINQIDRELWSIIKSPIAENYQIIGCGSSGSILISALLMHNDGEINLHPILNENSQKRTSRNELSQPIDDSWPSVVLDDDINEGKTLKRISEVLDSYKALHTVEIVAIPEADKHSKLILELFPNCKLIIG